MRIVRTLWVVVAVLLCGATIAAAQQPVSEPARSRHALLVWHRLVLELVRHTATYSPPVASRAFAYLGVTAFEALATGSDGLHSLAGQLNELTPVPPREAGQSYDGAVVVQAAMAHAAAALFENTGPTGQRAMAAMARKAAADAALGVPEEVVRRSEDYGRAVARHILAWAATDGGATIENMGFPLDYKLTEGPAHWVPTNLVRQQQFPLLPDWGRTRTFAMPDGASCGLPPPPAYSEAPGSQFYIEASEVRDTVNGLTDEQRAIARFWSDDPMLSPTPPGHWISIAIGILEKEDADLVTSAETLVRLGVTLADAFIGCWHSKFEYDLVRPLTYIRRVIDPKWEAILNTPPFPEYPSGHSTQSGAAATVLTDMFGPAYAFEDGTHSDDGLPARRFASFWAAAEEAGISRLYGGIHFRSAIERGLDQGRCVGAYANALRTRN
ncbi:vanadium-dependent haloperoxidase [Mesorhizobium sp. J428]|uniref:vanadium-dependent haloperoxidase n=1 Tax=Mesorhizobium sp. J428 TaxID=2898440 RepID=UPI00215103A6|nr:vanadium-dependent haloperoxidase [Mesorhizobium sp. J428]MCR5856885.1 vanadium-dependent haloperoxidase [Mesorhizobium sp. J428]